MSTLRREIGRIPRQLTKLSAPHLVRLRWLMARRQNVHGRAHGLPGRLIISLTSYPSRYGTLPLTLKALLSQSVRPDKVLLWVADADFDALPREVIDLVSEAFEIGRAPNLRSYLKIIPTLRAHPDAFIVTADDDVYYHQDWLAELVAACLENGGRTIAHRARRILVDESGHWKPYADWQTDRGTSSGSSSLFATGVGGVLYPPHSLHPTVCDEATFLALCPTADDIWLYWMTRMAGTKVCSLGWTRNVINWRGSQVSSLYKGNVLQGGNETQLQAIARHFGWPSLQE
jgi:hypothetical protein